MKEVTGWAARCGDCLSPSSARIRALARGLFFEALSHFSDEESEALERGCPSLLSSGLLTPNPVPFPGTADPDWCPRTFINLYRLSMGGEGVATAGTRLK